MHIRNIVRLIIIYVIRRYFVVFLLFSIILLGIIRKLYAGDVNNKVYTKAAKKGGLMPFSNIGFRLSGFISGIIPIIPRISKDSIIIVYIILILDMVVIPNISVTKVIDVFVRYWDMMKLLVLNSIVSVNIIYIMVRIIFIIVPNVFPYIIFVFICIGLSIS